MWSIWELPGSSSKPAIPSTKSGCLLRRSGKRRSPSIWFWSLQLALANLEAEAASWLGSSTTWLCSWRRIPREHILMWTFCCVLIFWCKKYCINLKFSRFNTTFLHSVYLKEQKVHLYFLHELFQLRHFQHNLKCVAFFIQPEAMVLLNSNIFFSISLSIICMDYNVYLHM